VFGAGIASPAVNFREIDIRVADASRIAERSACYGRHTRMMKVNLNDFRVASSVEHPDDVESFVMWDRLHAAPNVATIRTNRAQSPQDNVERDYASVGHRENNGQGSENRRLGHCDRHLPSLSDSDVRETVRRLENNCGQESHERQTDRRDDERGHYVTHEATFRPISRTSSRCGSPNVVMADGGCENYGYGRNDYVERDDDRHFDRSWRGDIALSPRRYAIAAMRWLTNGDTWFAKEVGADGDSQFRTIHYRLGMTAGLLIFRMMHSMQTD
jgi:hypothetical protein